MIIGVAREIKVGENRVALLPSGVDELVRAGHQVLVEKSAGFGSGLTDSDYEKFGAKIVKDSQSIFSQAELVLKVKEPLIDEARQLRPGQTIFTYLHLAANEELTHILQESGCTALAYETVRAADGSFPLLTPMSEIAGRMSIQEGAKYLETPQGGRGILLSGVAGVSPGNVLVLGAGVVGRNAAKIAAGFGANVVVMDINVQRLREINESLPANVTTIYSNRLNLHEQLQRADLVIGAVLIPGARAPRLITTDDLKIMRPGAVVVDVCIDQGGCFETSRPTSHAEPTYIVDQIVHYCVTNMPGAVSRTSTFALCNSTFPYILQLANHGLAKSVARDSGFAEAINIHDGKVCHAGLAGSLGLPCDSYVG